MATPTLHGFPVSPYVRSVRIALAEKGVAHDYKAIGFEDLKTEAYGQLNPFRKMPVWVAADGFVVYETPAILGFLEETEAGPSLVPTNARARADMARWVGISSSYLYPTAVMQVFLHRVLLPVMGGAPDEALIAEAAETLGGYMPVLDAEIAGATLLPSGFSHADILVACMLDLAALAPEGAAIIAGFPKVQAWLDGLRARPSFQATFPEMLKPKG